MSAVYEPHVVEEKWAARWRTAGVGRFERKGGRKFYVLEMFPYTSGRLHSGHARNYAMGDALARLHRALGDDVLYPMGWDAFGLPAENAAKRSGIHPRTFTTDAIASMKAAMDRLGFSYDWTHEINSSEASYIKAQQQLFLAFFARGLVYRDTSWVNWCPQCNTVLANEQAAGGVCWRCESQVTKRRVPQWFVDIRQYADELLDGLDALPGWPDSTKNIQRSWIGRSEGAEITFDVAGHPLTVFTTRADTLFGCTFLALAPEHRLLDELPLDEERRRELVAFRERILAQPAEERARDQAKVGVFTGHHAVNPINGERVPLYVANYVLMDYGTGAIMAVPAHDERDFDFARAAGLPVRRVIAPEGVAPDAEMAEAYVGPGALVNSGDFDGMSSEAARDAIAARLAGAGLGRKTRNYRLQNWSVSRQRYWGNPIPIIHCGACGARPVPAADLPVLLPEEVDFSSSGNPLAQHEGYMNVACPACGGPARRDPDTMDTFVDSAWYFLRFVSPGAAEPFERAEVDRMLPVDLYIGGVEHATLHLMYSRFMVKALRDLGMVGFDEPFLRLHNHGMVNDALGRKQSKSLGNVIEPVKVVEEVGADAIRLYLLFVTAYNAPIDWNEEGPRDALQYLSRVYRIILRHREDAARHPGLVFDADACAAGPARNLRRMTHETIQRVGADVEGFRFNTAIAQLMTLTNELSTYDPGAPRQPVAVALRILARMLGLFAPHFAEEAWELLGGTGLVAQAPWPEVDPAALVADVKAIAVQINGKLAAELVLPVAADEDEILREAMGNTRVARRMEGKSLRKVIHVPGRLVNLVIG